MSQCQECYERAPVDAGGCCESCRAREARLIESYKSGPVDDYERDHLTAVSDATDPSK